MPERLSHGLRKKLLKARAERLRNSHGLLAKYVERLADTRPNSTVILYGSRAAGDFRPYSDYDIMVILRNVEDPLREIERLRSLKPRGVSLDLTVISIEDLGDPPYLRCWKTPSSSTMGLSLKTWL